MCCVGVLNFNIIIITQIVVKDRLYPKSTKLSDLPMNKVRLDMTFHQLNTDWSTFNHAMEGT